MTIPLRHENIIFFGAPLKKLVILCGFTAGGRAPVFCVAVVRFAVRIYRPSGPTQHVRRLLELTRLRCVLRDIAAAPPNFPSVMHVDHLINLAGQFGSSVYWSFWLVNLVGQLLLVGFGWSIWLGNIIGTIVFWAEKCYPHHSTAPEAYCSLMLRSRLYCTFGHFGWVV